MPLAADKHLIQQLLIDIVNTSLHGKVNGHLFT